MNSHRVNDEMEKLNIIIMDIRSERNAEAAKRKKNRMKKNSSSARRKLIRQKLRSGGIIGGASSGSSRFKSSGDNRKRKIQDPISASNSSLNIEAAFDLLTGSMGCDSIYDVVSLYNNTQDQMFQAYTEIQSTQQEVSRINAMIQSIRAQCSKYKSAETQDSGRKLELSKSYVVFESFRVVFFIRVK